MSRTTVLEDPTVKKKRNVYKDPALLRKKRRDAGAQPAAKRKRPEVPPVPSNRSLRTSTLTKSQTGVLARAAIAEEAKRQAATRQQPAGVQVVVRLSQRQLLLEAARTEVSNVQAVHQLQQYAEEQKRAKLPRRRGTGARRIRHSRVGLPTTITFTDVDTFPACINDDRRPGERI